MIIETKKQLKVVAPKQPVVIGKIGSAYGIRGWIKIFSSTKNILSIFDYQPWLIHRVNKWQCLELESWKRSRQNLIIKVKGISSRDDIRLLTHCEIIIESWQLPSLAENDYYWKDLIGCQVATVTGYELGKVIDMMETGSNDVMIIKSNLKDAFGIKERLIPFLHKQVVKKVNFNARMIEVEWDPNF